MGLTYKARVLLAISFIVSGGLIIGRIPDNTEEMLILIVGILLLLIGYFAIIDWLQNQEVI